MTKTTNHPCQSCVIVKTNKPKNTSISALREKFPEVCTYCPPQRRHRLHQANTSEKMFLASMEMSK